MGERNIFGLLLVPLLVVIDLSFAEDIPVYFKVGGDLKLRPDFQGLINNVLWKLKGDLVAEWVSNAVPLTYYGRFVNRTSLDYATGVLVMRQLTEADEGGFTVEINSNVLAQRFLSEAILEVPEPKVRYQPIGCHAEMDVCSLVCAGDIANAGPVSYGWKEGDGGWLQKKESTIEITKAGSSHVKTYTCMIKNPVSERQSEPKDNVFYVDGPDVGMALGISIPLILAVAGALVLWKFREKIFKRQGDGNRPNGVPLETSPTDPEEKPLNNA